MDDVTLLLLWGKTRDKRDPDPREYHPLIYHLIDVGVAAEALWPLLPPRARARIAAMMGVDEEEAQRANTLLIALHDLGKASGFQAKVPGLWKRLDQAGIAIDDVDSGAHHAFVSAALLPVLLTQTDACGLQVESQVLAASMANAVGAHHGTFPDKTSFSSSVLGGALWETLREALARRLARALFPEAPPVRLTASDLADPAAGVLLTGLTAVADWIGSNQRFFDLCLDPDIDAYAARARTTANKALRELGWTPTPRFAPPLPFAEIVWGKDSAGEPIRFSPRGVQRLVEEMADTASGPFLLLVEAAMGEGKTEAALYATDRALTTGNAPGVAMGLPTQATGNAMFNRVMEFLKDRGHSMDLNLQLLHGHAEFHAEFQALIQLGANSARGEDSPVVAQSWFTKKKQALLAPFGVGTIDQSLMGVLQTKHWFVRLFGLAGKVVIFDEVHAYDAYMNALLRRLIAWLSALDCSVVLLSATLPQATRSELVEAFAPGVALPAAPYPRVTFVPRDSIPRCESSGLPADGNRVTLDVHPPDYAALAGKLLADLPGGGCSVVLCNTVANAQAAYATLRAALPENWEVLLFHARTPLRWRKAREKQVLDKLGKPSRPGVDRPERLVLIGTQVLEQSLDYDADWMASEFAPIDLLLQRMGRLWRHDRQERPVKGRRFTLLVNAPQEAGGLPSFPAGSDLVYDRYLLLRTWMALRERATITLPHEIEALVQSVYDAPEPAELPEAWKQALTESQTRMQRDNGDEENQANRNLIPGWRKRNGKAKAFSSVYTEPVRLDDDEDPNTHESLKATTRLGDPSITLVCLKRQEDGSYAPYCDGGAIDLERKPGLKLVKNLLLSAVSVSRPKGLFYTLLHQPVLEAWSEDSHLRHARHAVFDEIGSATIGRYVLHLDEPTGLYIEKETAE